MITRRVINDAGAIWTRTISASNSPTICALPNGRLLVGNNSERGLKYTDDMREASINNITLHSIGLTDLSAECAFTTFKLLPIGRILANMANMSNGKHYIGYSDDNGETWTVIPDTYRIEVGTILIAKNGRLITKDIYTAAKWYYSDNNGETWSQLFSTDNTTTRMCGVTSTGRILKFRSYPDTLQYSDDNGETWIDTAVCWSDYVLLCITASTGRVIIIQDNASDGHFNIKYSDDNGETWQGNYHIEYDQRPSSYVITDTGRIVVSIQYIQGYVPGFIYSDDNGTTWTRVGVSVNYNTTFYNLCKLPNRTLLACAKYGRSGIYISDPEIQTKFPKYLDQNGVQEIVTQFKAYCDAKVGA